MRQLKIALIFALCFCVATPAMVFANVTGTEVRTTVGTVENNLSEYLQKKHPDIQLGSQEYAEYLTDLLIYENDQQLARRTDYEDIKIYASEYLNQTNNKDATVVGKNSAGEKVSMLSMKEKDKSIDTVVMEANAQETIDKALSQDNTSQITPYAAYSDSKAIEYAKKWAKNRNMAYNSHSADCTNFVSQCVKAGGKTMTKPAKTTPKLPVGIYKTTKYWYSVAYTQRVTKWKESSSFVNVGDFYTYWGNHGVKKVSYASLSKLQNGAIPGDVVQLKNGKGKWFHSIIITGGSKGARKYCGHSSARLNEPVAKLKNQAISFRCLKF